ncbi:MAG: nucleotide sugar dehydrogenase, partial [Pirellulales bacterium]
VKLVENTYRDINIAFANELASIAESLHFDVHEAIELANHHPRVNILSPGPGVGGHCISVDPWFLIHAAPEECQLIHTARQINDQKPTVLFKQIIKLIKDFNIQAVGCLGLTYKANVDDLRESPSLTIVKMLSESNSSDLYICDPLIPQERIPDIPLTSLEATIQNSELLVLLTDHKEFIDIPQHILKTKYVVDCRGSWRQHHRSVEKTVKTVITKQAA